MYRAVKVVRREDFEYQRTFEREFEGIQRYEKVSHEHPGLVDILHVGRDDEAGFYYYVMEIADDESGGTVEERLEGYRPRTLFSDIRRRSIRTVRECVDLGIAIGGALGHLHHAGLTHRDVKPSNIIFVKGQPKLADVGLVASTGQRTFVGTEGYVPPEGPGTSSADLYSLAMVLYEMHTGKDRLDFPELPTNLEIPPSVNRDEWRALNAVICRAGSPDPRKRYESAAVFVLALETVCAAPWKAPAPRRSFASALFGTVAVLGLLGIVGFAGYWLWKDNESFIAQHGPLLSDAGAKGVNGAGLRTPIEVKPIENGGANPVESPTQEGRVDEPKEKGKEKEKETPKEPAKEVVKAPEPPRDDPEKDSKAKTEDPEPVKVVEKTPEPDPAKEKGEGPMLVATEVKGSEEKEKGKPLTAELVQGQLKISSQPPTAKVFHEGREIGVTETRLLDFPVGPVELVLKREGYHDYVYQGEVKEGAQVVSAILLPDLGPVSGQTWLNSVGMEFRPVPIDRHQSVGEVTVALFDRFLEETQLEIPRAGVNGVVQVSEDRALWQFCDWLTGQDRRSGHLGKGHYYRPFRTDTSGRKNSFVVTLEHEFGSLALNSTPEGATVYRDGAYLGETPVVLNDLRLGAFEIELYREGHEVAVAMGELTGTEVQDLVVALEPDASVVFGNRWTNSQQMELIPVGGLLVAKTETPLRAFLEYRTDQGVVLDPAAVATGLNYPAAGVGYDEAVAFCEWLTVRERKANLIRPWQRYRLPTDLEWSSLVGLSGESGANPAQRNQPSANRFPWGTDWPPPPGAGNFADVSATGFFGGNIIAGYTDGFETTAPVGSFGASASGIHDLAGNVWEWVQDPYTDGGDGLQVVRGGGWNSAEREVLASGYRNPVPATAQEGFYGFRYVLEEVGVGE
jgi:eukaryotic-like serine/threonine-protein kinase